MFSEAESREPKFNFFGMNSFNNNLAHFFVYFTIANHFRQLIHELVNISS